MNVLDMPAPQVDTPTQNQPSPTTIAETLDKAADLLEKGWRRFELWNFQAGPIETSDSFCALGAIKRIAGCGTVNGDTSVCMSLYTELEMRTINYLVTYARLVEPCRHPQGVIANWNNHSSQESVVATFRGAALKAYQQGI